MAQRAQRLVRPGDNALFRVGDSVVERVGSGDSAMRFDTKIVEVDGAVCMTATGYFYDVLTGASKTGGDEYRAIHSTSYVGATAG